MVGSMPSYKQKRHCVSFNQKFISLVLFISQVQYDRVNWPQSTDVHLDKLEPKQIIKELFTKLSLIFIILKEFYNKN